MCETCSSFTHNSNLDAQTGLNVLAKVTQDLTGLFGPANVAQPVSQIKQPLPIAPPDQSFGIGAIGLGATAFVAIIYYFFIRKA